eukprot:9472177-Pyramimonas_sp.AAC.1
MEVAGAEAVGVHRLGHRRDRTRDEILQGQLDRRSRRPSSLDYGGQPSPRPEVGADRPKDQRLAQGRPRTSGTRPRAALK